MTDDDGDEFVDTLLEWYTDNGRHDLPWRDPNATPFEILIAEYMLQQTSVEQVLGVYEEFVGKYPTPASIVDAESDEFGEDLEPLGLHKRTAYVERASEQIIGQYDGEVPNRLDELLDLHGVGEYTAASVLAHAYDGDVAAVDTNVARILARVFGLETEDEPDARENWELAERLAPSDRCGDFVHALIDFGASVCTASNPNCEGCPASGLCEYTDTEHD
ncbi:HhH-GPD family protein [Natronococcus wangiae]|uniref:hypothetical protein n=1 Tax=Natronococcus wangiae TaxID=3068275 RepID=UPI00273D14F3|nr:hypothetical protein [Natronococcus sp. AD5]